MIQVGAGAWGESWARIIAGHPDWQLVALADLAEPARLRAGAAAGLQPDDCFAS